MIKNLLKLTDKQLYSYIIKTLPGNYVKHKDYIVTRYHAKPGPLICVHLDTVSKLPPALIKVHNGIISAPQSPCLGGDDRAGVWIALEMIKQSTATQFEYGFFMGEEEGGIGSRAYARTKPNHTCYIGLDRTTHDGKQNTALYGYDNHELISCFPYPTSQGTMSDCSVLSQWTDKACVNVSVGYDHEHTSRETLTLSQMIETLNVMLKIDIPAIDYLYDDDILDPVVCDFCGEHEILYKYMKYQVCEQCFYLL